MFPFASLVFQLQLAVSDDISSKLLTLHAYEMARSSGSSLDPVYYANACVLLHDDNIYRLEHVSGSLMGLMVSICFASHSAPNMYPPKQPLQQQNLEMQGTCLITLLCCQAVLMWLCINCGAADWSCWRSVRADSPAHGGQPGEAGCSSGELGCCLRPPLVPLFALDIRASSRAQRCISGQVRSCSRPRGELAKLPMLEIA